MGTKEKLLELFETNKGIYFSGEEIAGRLGISRTAVWKAVKNLRGDGYNIEAVSNKGYCLAVNTDILSAQGIQKYLESVCRDIRVEVVSEISSTNAEVRKRASAGETEGYVLIAGQQTAGKGRIGRSFFSPPNTGIYMSLLLRPKNYSSQQAVKLTTMAAVAACEAIEETAAAKDKENKKALEGAETSTEAAKGEKTAEPKSAEAENTKVETVGKKAQIKWVNDIYIEGKKVSGILTEASFGLEDGLLEYAVLGIGINVYAPSGGFPSEIENIAGAVFDKSQNDGKNRLAAEFLNHFMKYYRANEQTDYKENYQGNCREDCGKNYQEDCQKNCRKNYQENCQKNYVEEYKKRSLVIGKNVQVISNGTARNAMAYGIDDNCRLLVRYADGKEESLSSGEISVRPDGNAGA